MAKNYYDLLGVSRDASLEEITRAFRRQARNMHPDTGTKPTTNAQFGEIKEAFDTLRNERERRAYDASLKTETRLSSGPRWGGIQPKTLDWFDSFGTDIFGGFLSKDWKTDHPDVWITTRAHQSLVKALMDSYKTGDGAWYINPTNEDKERGITSAIYKVIVKDGTQQIFRCVEDWRKPEDRGKDYTVRQWASSDTETIKQNRLLGAYYLWGRGLTLIEGVSIPRGFDRLAVATDSLAHKLAHISEQGGSVNVAPEIDTINTFWYREFHNGDLRVKKWMPEKMLGDIETKARYVERAHQGNPERR